MTDLNADVEKYLQAAGLDAPPPIESDPLVTGATPIEQLLRILGLAANADDPEDIAEGLDEYIRREDKTTEAAEKFAAQDQTAADQVAQVATGIAGALAGALGSVLQPLTQIPQQLGQGATQALQTGLGVLGGPAPRPQRPISEPLLDDFTTAADDVEPSTDEFDGPDDIGPPGEIGNGMGFPGSPVGFGATAPAAALGPAPTPTSPSPTTPSPPPARTGPPAAPAHAPAGMPLIPPMMATPGAAEQPAKTDTKRVSVPTVRNGAPVQGRLTTGPIEPAAATPSGGTNRRATTPAGG